MMDKSIVSSYYFQGSLFGELQSIYKGCKSFVAVKMQAAKCYNYHNLGLIGHMVILDLLVCEDGYFKMEFMPEMQGPF